ncbi:hypothetical protein BS78_04G012200 [Paspalum vaginatum]|nr:hypothetical protein BS78_04G012200 [Paspalum vaginatum]
MSGEVPEGVGAVGCLVELVSYTKDKRLPWILNSTHGHAIQSHSVGVSVAAEITVLDLVSELLRCYFSSLCSLSLTNVACDQVYLAAEVAEQS